MRRTAHRFIRRCKRRHASASRLEMREVGERAPQPLGGKPEGGVGAGAKDKPTATERTAGRPLHIHRLQPRLHRLPQGYRCRRGAPRATGAKDVEGLPTGGGSAKGSNNRQEGIGGIQGCREVCARRGAEAVGGRRGMHGNHNPSGSAYGGECGEGGASARQCVGKCCREERHRGILPTAATAKFCAATSRRLLRGGRRHRSAACSDPAPPRLSPPSGAFPPRGGSRNKTLHPPHRGGYRFSLPSANVFKKTPPTFTSRRRHINFKNHH